MNSKLDRLNSSFENIEEAIKYYLKDIDNNYYLHKVSKKEHDKIAKDLKDINIILSNLKFSTPPKNKGLDEIRSLNLSVMSLYEEGDYDILFSEMLRTNNNIFRDAKEKDRKKLGNFKKIVNNLSNFYQYRLRKAEKDPLEGLTFRDKGLDNIKFIIEKYLSVKYHFKKVKYEPATISSINQHKIDEYTKIIESNKYDNSIKDYYLNIINYITKYAKAEIIIDYLEKIKVICDENEYVTIKEQTQKMIDKYQKIYEENKEKYDIESQDLNSKKVIEHQNNEFENISKIENTDQKLNQDIKKLKELKALLNNTVLEEINSAKQNDEQGIKKIR